MLSIYQLKPKFQALLRPLAAKLYNANVTANQVTIATCVGSIMLALLVWGMIPHWWIFGLIPVWMLVRMALNAIDGILARDFNQQSYLGAYLNDLGDVIADTALLLIFAFIPQVNLAIVLLTIFFSILTEYVGVMSSTMGVVRCYDGPMGKSDRAFIVGIISIAIALEWLPLSWINYLLLLILGLLIYTLINRIKQGIKQAVIKNN